MSATCETCRFWKQTVWESFALGLTSAGDCSRLIATRAERDTAARIFPVDAAAWLRTNAKFGCGEHHPITEREGA